VAQDTYYVESDYVVSGYFGVQRNATITWQIGSYTEADYVATDYFEDFGTRGSFATLTVTTVQVEGSATLSASASVSATGTRQHNASASASASASTSVTTLVQRGGEATFSASSSLLATPNANRGIEQTLTATATQSASGGALRGTSPTFNTVTSQSVRGDVVIRSNTATLQGAYAIAGLMGIQYTITASNNKSWDYENRTWQTYWGQVWGRPYLVIAAESELDAIPGVARDSGAVSFVTTATITPVTNVGETTPASATLDSTATLTSTVGAIRGITETLDSAAEFSSVGAVARGIELQLDAQAAVDAIAILEISASANLIAQTAIDVLTNAEADLSVSTSLFAIPNALRGLPITLEGIGSQSVISFVGETTPASASLSSAISVQFIGNYIKRNIQADLQGVASTLAIGGLITFDPYREYNVDQETRTIKVLPETGVFLVDKENRLNTVIQENNGILVPQETRRLGVPIATYSRRRELA
jgi:hypothetical protein